MPLVVATGMPTDASLAIAAFKEVTKQYESRMDRRVWRP